MATTAKKAPAKKVTAKKVTAKKAVAKKAPAKKASPKKANDFSFKDSADKAVNVYFGIIGQGIDKVKENLETARKENDKRVKQLEKRGAKLRAELTKRFDKVEMPKIEAPKFDEVVEDVKAQISKVQDQVEEVVENVKEKLTSAKAA
jgi:histidinol dehydrogenase